MKYKIKIASIGNYKIYEKEESIEISHSILSYFLNYIKHDSIIRKLKYKFFFFRINLPLIFILISFFISFFLPVLIYKYIFFLTVITIYDLYPYAKSILNNPHKIKFSKTDGVVKIVYWLTSNRISISKEIKIKFQNTPSQFIIMNDFKIASYNQYFLVINNYKIKLGSDNCIIEDDINIYKKKNQIRYKNIVTQVENFCKVINVYFGNQVLINSEISNRTNRTKNKFKRYYEKKTYHKSFHISFRNNWHLAHYKRIKKVEQLVSKIQKYFK